MTDVPRSITRMLRVIQLQTENIGLLRDEINDQKQLVKELTKAVAKLIVRDIPSNPPNDGAGNGVPPHVANRPAKPETETEHERSDPAYVWGSNGFPTPLDTFAKVMDSLRARGAVTPESVIRDLEADLEQRIKRLNDILKQFPEQ